MSESPNDFRNIVAFKDDDAVRKALGRAADALEQAQADLLKCHESRIAETIRDLPSIKAAFERIEQLEAAFQAIIDIDPDGLNCLSSKCVKIARDVTAGHMRHEHDWSDVDAFGWRRCRDTDCNAGMPPQIPKTTGDTGRGQLSG